MRLNLLLRSENIVIDELKKREREREKGTVKKKNRHCKSKPFKES